MPSDKPDRKAAKKSSGGKASGAPNVWSLVQKANKASKERRGGDTYMLVVGPKQAGKSSLISAFLQPRKAVDSNPKATVALEYTYGRRTATGGARKDVAHIWELGGGFKMKELVKVPLTMERVPKFVFCIVVDLSRPGDALEFLLKWMQIAKDRVAECMRRMKQEAGKVADGVMLRAKRRLGKNADLSRVNVCAMPIVVVGTKEDAFLRHDSAQRRELQRALRYVAHANGASFVSLNHKDSRQLDCFRAILNHYLFQTARPKFPRPEPTKAVAIMAGTDSYELIGLPAGAEKREMHGSPNTDPMERGKVAKWRDAVGVHFASTGAADEAFSATNRGGGFGAEGKAMEGGGEEGKSADGGVGLGSPDGQQEAHLEPLVDDMRAQKDAELEKYCKTVEQRQRFRGR